MSYVLMSADRAGTERKIACFPRLKDAVQVHTFLMDTPNVQNRYLTYLVFDESDPERGYFDEDRLQDMLAEGLPV